MIAGRPARDPLRLTFEFLIGYQPPAIGPTNAVPIDEIREHLADNGIRLSYSAFQQGPLAETRSTNDPIFIGTCSEGCFLIDTVEHARVMRDFYDMKIAAIETNRNHLFDQARRVGWDLS